MHEKRLMPMDKRLKTTPATAEQEMRDPICDAMLDNRMLPHEFLYLMANAIDR